VTVSAARPGALALNSLGTTELWAARFEEAEWHLEQCVALASTNRTAAAGRC
jgi:hypothetical protein